MNLQSKVFVPVIASLIVLGGSMYLLNRKILKESYNTEIQKTINEKASSFENNLNSYYNFLSQYSIVLANSNTIRSAFDNYNKTNNIDTSWYKINSEIDRIKFGGSQSRTMIPDINCYVPPGKILYNSNSIQKGEIILQKKKTIRVAFSEKKAIKGIEIDQKGIKICGIAPVLIKNNLLGLVEVSIPFSDLFNNLEDSYALIINHRFTNLMSKVDAAKVAENYINDDLILKHSEGFNRNLLIDIAFDDIDKIQILDDDNYTQLVIPIKNYDNEVLAYSVFQISKTNYIQNLNASSYSLFMISILIFIIASIILFLILNNLIIRPVKRTTRLLNLLAEGVISESISISSKDEISRMQQAMNILNHSLRKMASFASQIGNGEFNTSFTALSEKDELGNTLVQVRDKLKAASEQEIIQSKIETQRKWAVEGHSKFATLLQNNEMDVDEFTYHILSNLISYLDVNQGSFFILADDKKTLRLSSAYAYDRRKFLNKEIILGDGLLGNTALERKLTYITDLPEEYINITSGLGEAPPRSILIVPMISNMELLGVFELASFRNIEPFEIEFCESIAENIAQSISRQTTNYQTKVLLEQSKQQAEELSAQEEEMRQNLEEMQATQEEFEMRELEMQSTIEVINNAAAVLEYDFEGKILNANTNFTDLFGYTKEELIGVHHSIFFDNKDILESKNYQVFWENMRHKKPYSGIMKRIDKSGNEVIIKGVSEPFFDIEGNPLKVMELTFNITEESKK